MQNLRHRVLKILVQPPRKSTKSLVFSNCHTQLIPPQSTAWRFFSACEGTPVSLESCSPREHFHPVLRVPAMEEPPMKRPRLLNPDFQENAAIREDEGGRKETTFWDGDGKALQPRLSQQRRWEAIPGSKAKKEKSCSFDFLVLSYNILSQQLLEDNLWLYQHCRRDVLSWAFRFPQLISEISRFDADIVCLQEVQYSHFYEQIKPALSEMGYKCRYKVRTGDKRDGCAICFKRSRFDLLSWKPVEYFHPGVAVLNRDNVGGIVMLRPLGIPEANQLVDLQLCVANTHLLYNPRRGDVKLAQLAVLLAEIDWTSRQENSQCPVLLCGDFNSVPGSPLYRFIRDGSLYYRQMPIWQVSGQEELHGVNWNVLEAPLWPRSVGISPCCRYHKRSPPRDKEQTSEERETKKPTFDGDSSIHTSAAETKQDFNAQSTPLQRLAEVEGCSLQTREENFPNTIRHGMSFRSVYSHFIQAQEKAEATTCHSKTGVTVDYIFYSNPSGVSSPGKESTGVRLHLLERLALLSVADLWTENSLPNDVAPSDHLPLVAKFRLEW